MRPLRGKTFLRFLRAAAQIARRYPAWVVGEKAKVKS